MFHNCLKLVHLFLLFLFFFIAHFLLVENTYKNPYSLKAVKTVFIIYLEYAKVPHVSFFKYFFTACFLLVNLLVQIYRVSRKISYNRNPVNSFQAIAPLTGQ
jgi:hypothetical protein